ncbi:hypothetical protein H6P81_015691 [Aristolochia fimbriata]|uniref:Zinc finger PHD-type domain-containing protein n=1 Tax=Aristolochia fimbriata TaxID=158543 RepID=A0AAV7E7H3_ARIFI|nr:hypothetical protein H6P81_015691 [Aristolochia fimbriata]
METVCQKCGDAGYTEYLIFCKECKLYAEHSYCSDTFPSSDEDEDATWICEECSQLVSTNPLPPRKLDTFCNMFLFRKNMTSQLTEDEGGGEQFKRKKRRLILEDSSEEETETVLSDKDGIDEDASEIAGANDYVYSRPIIDPIWRGFFETDGRRYGRLAAHLSNKVSSTVFEVANRLESRLGLQKLPRTEAWPKSFSLYPPTDDNIALYFFPESQRDDIVFNELLDEVNRFDLVLTAELDNAQLLLFSSFLLPKDYWRFCGKCYIWGVFRRRQHSSSIGRGYPKLTGNHDIGIEDTSHLHSGITVGGTDGTASVTFPTERASRKSTFVFENLSARESSSLLSSPSRSRRPLMMENKSASNAELIKSVKLTQDSNGLRVTTSNCKHGSTSCHSENIGMTANDLELFPLKAENMAVPVVQRGGNTVLPSLELGIGLCGEEQREKRADSKACCDLSVQFDSDIVKLRNENFGEMRGSRPTLDVFKTSDMVEGTSMKDQLVKMMKHLQDLGDLGMNVYLDSQKNIILGSLPKWFEPYATNFFMNNPDLSLNHPSVDLEKAELLLKKYNESVAMTQLPRKELCGSGEGKGGNRAAENWSGSTDKFSPVEENTGANKTICVLLGSEEHHKNSDGKFGFCFPAEHESKLVNLLGENHNKIPSQQPTLEGQSVDELPRTDNMLETSMNDRMVMLKKYNEHLGNLEPTLYQHLRDFEGAKQRHLENMDDHVPSRKHAGEEQPLRHTGLGLPADEDCSKVFTGGSPRVDESHGLLNRQISVDGQSVLEKFKTTKMVEGSSVKDHMVKMIKYVQDLGNLGINVAPDVQRKVIFSSLPKCFEPSATKFFMQNHNFTLAQLLVDLEAEELRFKNSYAPIPLQQRKQAWRRKHCGRIEGHKRTDVDGSYKSSCNLSHASNSAQSIQVKEESHEHCSVANPEYKAPMPRRKDFGRIEGHTRTDVDGRYKSNRTVSPASNFPLSVQLKQESHEHRTFADRMYKVPVLGCENLNKSPAKVEDSLLEMFMSAKMVEGTPVKVHMIKMMKYLRDLGKHGAYVSLHMQRRAILSSLPDCLKRYAQVFFSRNPNFTLTQLLVELEVAELNLKEEKTGHSSSIASCVKRPQTAYVSGDRRNFKSQWGGDGYKRNGGCGTYSGRVAPVSSSNNRRLRKEETERRPGTNFPGKRRKFNPRWDNRCKGNASGGVIQRGVYQEFGRNDGGCFGVWRW